MENPVLPRHVILDAVLYHLGFSTPTYTYEYDENNRCRVQLRFTLDNNPNEASTHDIHSVSSGSFNSMEKAHEDAADRALLYLESKAKFQVHDFSYSIMKRVKHHNHVLSVEGCRMAKVLNKLLGSWLNMSNDIHHAGKACASQVIMQQLPDINLDRKSNIDSLLCRIDAVSQALYHLNKENLEDAYGIHGPMSDLLTEFLGPDESTNQQHAGEPMPIPIAIAPSVILLQVLTARDAPSPNYHHITQPDGKIVTSCTFYPWPNAPEYAEPLVIYGLPAMDNETARENSALRSLEYMETYLQVQLRDYNYYAKEREIDKNRGLMKKTIRFKAAMMETYHL